MADKPPQASAGYRTAGDIKGKQQNEYCEVITQAASILTAAMASMLQSSGHPLGLRFKLGSL